MRNSSLVEGSCAENVTGLSLPPKPWMFRCKGENFRPKGGPNGGTPMQIGGMPAATPPGQELDPLDTAWVW